MISLSQNKIWYEILDNREMKEFLGWMLWASISTYRNDEGTVFDEEYFAFWEHYYHLEKLAKNRGVSAYPSDCPHGMREMTLRQVLPRYLSPSRYSRTNAATKDRIILDSPQMKYYSMIKDVKEVEFLCGETNAHLIANLQEFGIKYRFLGIPVENWDMWKSKPEYRGDK